MACSRSTDFIEHGTHIAPLVEFAIGLMQNPTDLTLKRHAAKVAKIRDSVLSRPNGVKLTVRKDSVSHTIKDVSWKDKCHRVDVSELNEILGYVEDVDRDGKRVMAAVCEGQVQMGQLAEATLPHNHVARVVPDDLTFTVSGLINGEGIQTSAHRYGVFTTNVLEFECVQRTSRRRRRLLRRPRSNPYSVDPHRCEPVHSLATAVGLAYKVLGMVPQAQPWTRSLPASMRSARRPRNAWRPPHRWELLRERWWLIATRPFPRRRS
jgi:hypothetical protein